MLISFNEWKNKYTDFSNAATMTAPDVYFRKWDYNADYFNKDTPILQGKELPLKKIELKSEIENPEKKDISYAVKED